MPNAYLWFRGLRKCRGSSGAQNKQSARVIAQRSPEPLHCSVRARPCIAHWRPPRAGLDCGGHQEDPPGHPIEAAPSDGVYACTADKLRFVSEPLL